MGIFGAKVHVRKCEICGKEFKRLGKHTRASHGIEHIDYYLKYISNVIPKCSNPKCDNDASFHGVSEGFSLSCSISCSSVVRNSTTEYRDNNSRHRSEYMNRPEVKEFYSGLMKEKCKDPLFKMELSSRVTNYMLTEEGRNFNSDRMRDKHKEPEFRKFRSELMKSQYLNPEFKKSHNCTIRNQYIKLAESKGIYKGIFYIGVMKDMIKIGVCYDSSTDNHHINNRIYHLGEIEYYLSYSGSIRDVSYFECEVKNLYLPVKRTEFFGRDLLEEIKTSIPSSLVLIPR